MVIVDCSNLTTMDYSAAEAFFHGAEALKHVGISLKLCGLTVRNGVNSDCKLTIVEII